ncbi:MAG: NAD-dependent epimerase/dehydratase family protein [Candidatus Poribacteria bacterium]|jgi:nucleoside-diphosphate-sugar epimerase|nr:NAD-dependent epimerase/dehydratase family protein [Candidatus Poribacteria bacterium]MDP6996476.1 NAD-dependent epimerase/dehydratase family protein [Candidatus Poribacteria bacterium]
MKQKPTTKLRVLLTGAAGLVGTILRSAWELDDQYQLTAVDLNDSDSNIQKADIRQAAQMKAICQNQDVLVHLAYYWLPRHTKTLDSDDRYYSFHAVI